ncbi:hypothetical protein ACMBCN_02000 [Candidatus Liberibacter asiaticus]
MLDILFIYLFIIIIIIVAKEGHIVSRRHQTIAEFFLKILVEC